MPLHLATLQGHVSTCRFILLNKSLIRHFACNTMTKISEHRWNSLDTRNNPRSLSFCTERKYRDMYFTSEINAVVGLKGESVDTDLFLEERMANLVGSGTERSRRVTACSVLLRCGSLFPQLVFYFSVFIRFSNIEHKALWDKMGWHVINIQLIVACMYFFFQTTYTDPGKLNQKHPNVQYWRDLYGKN